MQNRLTNRSCSEQIRSARIELDYKRMKVKEKLIRQLKYFYLATDIHLQLSDERGTILRTYGEPFSYCELLREACGAQSFCAETHSDGNRHAVWLKEGYIYDCPCGLAHFSVPVMVDDKPIYHILAGPVALEYPDIMLIDQIIEAYGCSLNERKKLYGALRGVPVVEPVRLQYLNELLSAMAKDVSDAYGHADDEHAPAETEVDPSYQPVMKKALRYIGQHFREDLSLGQVADHVGLNASYLSTLFKQETGINFSRYLTERRVEEACRLLRETNMSLVAIASELGFGNQSYFSRIFKRQMGISPRTYRQGGGKE